MKTSTLICLLSFLAFIGYSNPQSAEQPQQDREVHRLQVQQSREGTRQVEILRQQADVSVAVVQTQQNPEASRQRQRVHAQKVAYFTEKLTLTPAEAERFWPLYNKYKNDRERLINEFSQKTRVQVDSSGRHEFNVSHLSDAEARKLVNDRAKLIDLDRRFHIELNRLFPDPRRVLAFYDAEREFQRELLRQHSSATSRSSGAQGGGGAPTRAPENRQSHIQE
jgi:hypothetical protein